MRRRSSRKWFRSVLLAVRKKKRIDGVVLSVLSVSQSKMCLAGYAVNVGIDAGASTMVIVETLEGEASE